MKDILTSLHFIEPMVTPSNIESQSEKILNAIDYMGITYKVYLPTINQANGPFRLTLMLI